MNYTLSTRTPSATRRHPLETRLTHRPEVLTRLYRLAETLGQWLGDDCSADQAKSFRLSPRTETIISIKRMKTSLFITAAMLTAFAAVADLNTNIFTKAPTAEMLPGKGPAQSGDWFDQAWRERRTEFDRRAASEHGALIFLGDSITQGWGEVAQHFPKFKCANRGISGDTTRGVLFRLQEDVLDLEPAAIVLLIGTNDIGLGADPADVADNMKAILASIRKTDANVPVVICKVMPRADRSMTNAAPKIQELNRRVDELVKADPQCFRCDTWSIYGAAGTATSGEFYDLLHLNPAGYTRWKTALDPILAKLNLPAAPAK